jgi:hypothetical protein
MSKPLTLRALNRATLARQLLLKREKVAALDAIEQLFALQAQVARPPHVALWSRVHGYEREELNGLFTSRKAVRGTMLRGTLHVMSAKDFLALRAAMQPGIDKGLRSILKERLDALELPGLLDFARAHFATPQPFDSLRDALAERFKKLDVRAAAYAVRCTLPLLQVPDDSEWGFPGTAGFVPAAQWLKKEPREKPDLEALVLRYLAAFGPATAADAQTFLGPVSLAGVFESLRKKLVVLETQDGKPVFDLPDAPRPDEDTEAPVRFLAEFDSLLLAHADRSRLVPEAYRKALITKNLQIPGTVLVDGLVAATWKATDKELTVSPFAKLSKAALDAVNTEAQGLVRLLGRAQKITIQPR